MKHTLSIITTTFLLLISGDALAQSITIMQPSKIGDPIPDKVWNLPLQVVNHPEGKETITLAAYKGKLIIIDFWATWCTACLKGFPLLDSLQKLHPEMKVVKVTDEKLNPSQTQKYMSVVGDSTLSQIFPHRGIPYYVWINPKGDLHGFSSTDQLTASHITEALKNEPASFAINRYLDTERPLFLAEDFQMQGLKYYAVLHQGRYYGVVPRNYPRMTGDTLTGLALANRSLFELFSSTARGLFEQRNQLYTANRISVEVADSTGLFIDYSNVDKNNLYTYDINVAPEKADRLFEIMLDDLNRHTKYHGEIETCKVDCYVLRNIGTGTETKLASKGGQAKSKLSFGQPIALNNRPLRFLIYFLNSFDQIPHVVLDETGYDGPVDIQLPAFTSVEELTVNLQAYDLVLEKAERTIPMFIIREKEE